MFSKHFVAVGIKPLIDDSPIGGCIDFSTIDVDMLYFYQKKIKMCAICLSTDIYFYSTK